MHIKHQIHENNCFNLGSNVHSGVWPSSQEEEFASSGMGCENFQGQKIHSSTNLLEDHFSVSKGLCENAYQSEDVQ